MSAPASPGRRLARLGPGGRVSGRLDDGTRFEADVVRVERDQTGVRAVVVPPGVSAPADRCRLRATRVGDDWGAVALDRPTGDGWTRRATVVDLRAD